MADYSGAFGQYDPLQQPAQDPFAPLLAPPPPTMPKPKPASPYEARQQEMIDAQNAASMAAALKQQAQQDTIIAKTSANEATRANREREVEETRAKVFADVDAKQQALITEATQGEKVDPRGRFGNAGTGAKLAMGIMGFLQGFIDPKGGPGKMAAWVDSIVQKDIATQMANIEQRNRVLGMKQSALDKTAARDSGMLDAQLAATARAYDGAQRIIAAEAAKNPAMAEMAQAAQADLQMKMQEKFEVVRQQNRQIGIQAAGVALDKQRFEEQKKQNALNFFVGQNDRITEQANKERALGAAKEAKLAAGQAVPEGALRNTGDPRGYSVVDKSLLSKAVEKKDGIERKIALNRQMEQLMKDNPGHQWANFAKTDDAKAIMDKLAGDMVLADAMANGQGALGDAEYDRRKKQLLGGEVGAWFGGNRANPKLFADNIRAAEKDYNRFLRTASDFKGDVQFVPETGEWVPRVASQQDGAIVGDAQPSRLTANARGKDENGRPRDIPFQPLIEDQVASPNVGPALIDYYRLLQQQRPPGS